MALSINTNLWSLNAQRALALSQADFTRSSERLSTFLRINRASDDPTGNAVVERYTAQINGIEQARLNLSHGTAFAQHADSNLESVNDQLLTIRKKIVAANGTSDPLALQALQNEVKVALSEVERLVQSTEFDGRKILNGSSTNSVFQVGPNAADTVGITIGNFQISKLGLYRLKGNPSGHNAKVARGGAGELLTLKGLNTRTVLIGGSGPGASAKAIASAVNGVRETTGISASARTDVEIITWLQGSYSFEIKSKGDVGVPVTAVVNVPGNVATADSFVNLIAAINNETNRTGVEASLNGEGDGIVLTNAEGDNITLTFSAVGLPSALVLKEPTVSRVIPPNGSSYIYAIAPFPLTSPTPFAFTGQVMFDSETPFTVSSVPLTSTGVPTPATTPYPGAGLTLPQDPAKLKEPTATRTSALVPILDIDVTGPNLTGTGNPFPVISDSWLLQGALREAFAVIDHAMAAVATQQAALGSVQNRFDAIIENLGSDHDNLTVARSYIRDADIALEKSIQSQARLQFEANIAVLGQANTLQQAVLALLR